MTDHVGAARRIIEPKLELVGPALERAQFARTVPERLAALQDAMDLLLECGSAAMTAANAEVRDAGTDAVMVLAQRIRRNGTPLKLVEG